ncbi:hypothetical protein MMC26_001059 [Xylographa opegraphella]|nr:hypothetical protein [Xylographa opegraphella]
MPVPPLYYLARKACIKNIRSITDIGDIPYDLVRPILLKLENPEQLHILEEASPQLCGADAEIWRIFIARDIPKWESKPHEPKNPKNWYKVYRKLRLESQNEVDADAELLKAKMEGIKNEKAKHTSKIVDPRTVPKLPRMGGMRLEGGRSKSGPSSSNNLSSLRFTSGSKTKVLTGSGVIAKVRREGKEMSLFSSKNSHLTTPTHKLSDRATQIRKVPQGLVEDHRRPSAPLPTNPSSKPTTIFAPRRRNTGGEISSPRGLTFEEREKRLRTLTGCTPSTERSLTTTVTTQNVSASSPPMTTNTTYPSSAYVAPRVKPLTLEHAGHRPLPKVKAPVDPFMPAKRRRVV